MNYKKLRVTLFLLAAIMVAGTMFAQTNSTDPADYPTMNYSLPKRYVVKDISVQGVQTLDEETLINSSGMAVGDTVYIPGDYISDATRKLWTLRFFSDIRIDAEVEGDEVSLKIYMKERPRVYDWKFEGLKKNEITDLTTKLHLGRGVELSADRVNTSISTIKEYLAAKSYLNATVDIVEIPDTTIRNGVNVTFNVNKGPKVKIAEITFDGNEAFKPRALRKALKKTKKKNLNFFVSSKFNRENFDADKVNLIDFYNSKGYRNALIVSDSVYDISDSRVGINIDLEEGNKFYYRNISWIGNSKLNNDQLDLVLGIKPGDTYDRLTMNERLGINNMNPDAYTVSSIYQDDGYLMFDISTHEMVAAEDSVDVEIKMIEGRQATINRVTITGNNRVNDQVIRREVENLPGELFSRTYLINSARRLASMGHFNQEQTFPDVQPVSAELVDLQFDLEEQPSDQFELSGGWGASTFIGSVGVVLNNVSIKNFFKKGAWRPYPSGEGQQLALRAQSNGSYYKAFSLSFTEPWLGGKKPHSLTLSANFSDQNDAYYAWESSDSYFRTFGVAVGLGRRLKWPDQDFTLYNELFYQLYHLKDWSSFIISNGNSNIVGLRTTLSRNTMGQTIYPRSGSEIAASVTLTPPFSLFDGKDYDSDKLSENERYRWIEYHKWNFKADWYFPLTQDQKLVLRAKAEMGFIGDYNKNKPSPFEGYEMGGDGLSGYNIYGVDIIGLRGYGNSSLTPSGTYSRAYNKYTVELRYPFVLKPTSTIFALLFAEAGNAFAEVKNFDPFLVKRTLGVGLRVYLPFVGLIGVDWGYGFDRTPDGKGRKGEIHFVIGQQY